MVKEKHIIMGVHVTDRAKHVQKVQEAFTEFGCYIKTRIGLHETGDGYCSTNGLIILEVLGKDDKADELHKALEAIEGIEVKQIVFEHDAGNMA